MTTIHSLTPDGQEHIVSCSSLDSRNIAKQIKILQNKGMLNIRVLPRETKNDDVIQRVSTDVQVAPGIWQSAEDFQANHEYDEMKDNQLMDFSDKSNVY